jgi:orotidine-5'-phosphate decarboxylase
MRILARDRLVVAPYSVPEAYTFIDDLSDLFDIVKVGWPLYMAEGGREIIGKVKERGKRVFLDLKFGDITETVKHLVEVAMEQEVGFITVNTSLQTLRAAVAARGSASEPKILTVTLLTSLDKEDLEEMGFTRGVEDFVLHKTRGAAQAKCDGVVASGQEAAAIRELVGEEFLIVTPGIRPTGVGHDDHKRAATPTEAIRNGADYLVVGRPIINAPSPRDATERILEEMQAAFDRYR